jgi:hypothetical protein
MLNSCPLCWQGFRDPLEALQDDIILDRAFEQGKLGINHEPSTTIDRPKIVVAKDAAGRHFQACQNLCERLFSRRSFRQG